MKKNLQYFKEKKDLELKKLGASFTIEALAGEIKFLDSQHFEVQLGDQSLKGTYLRKSDWVEFHCALGHYRFQLPPALAGGEEANNAEDFKAPMPGKLLKVLVQPGQAVQAGEKLLVLEAMKMEHAIISPAAGVVEKICFAEGDRLSLGQELLLFKAAD